MARAMKNPAVAQLMLHVSNYFSHFHNQAHVNGQGWLHLMAPPVNVPVSEHLGQALAALSGRVSISLYIIIRSPSMHANTGQCVIVSVVPSVVIVNVYGLAPGRPVHHWRPCIPTISRRIHETRPPLDQ